MAKATMNNIGDIRSAWAYLHRIHANAQGMLHAVIIEQKGLYWEDKTIIRFAKDGSIAEGKKPQSLVAIYPPNKDLEPTEEELAAMAAEFKTIEWPSWQPLKKVPKLSPLLAKASEDNLYMYHDVNGDFLMLQLRMDPKKKGEDKRYIPWTYWSDGIWRSGNPDGLLPLWGLDGIGNKTNIMIHEGAKAARYMRWLTEARTPDARKALESHPWGRELSAYAHVGWQGGALNPQRTDWGTLARIGAIQAVIVPDNDYAGKSATKKIAEELNMITLKVQFTESFPVSFDLADEFPKDMFVKIDGIDFYKGPSLKECLYPFTWMTTVVYSKATKKYTNVLRAHARDLWIHIPELKLYINRDMPHIRMDREGLRSMLLPLSDVKDAVDLVIGEQLDNPLKIVYLPGVKHKITDHNGHPSLNIHIPSDVPPIAGDPTPWLRFLEYLFPIGDERTHAMRWMATLIARPKVRMGWSVLMISTKQGIGKTTLGSSILAPLVGMSNVSYPGESDILSDFNGWAGLKRFIIVNEIYAGHNFKAANKLKTIVTDQYINLNDKFRVPFTIENWAHIYACSNRMDALKIDNNDRRWFAPTVNNVIWPEKEFEKLYAWISGNGLGIIRHWAENFGSYVRPGEHAPMTERKREIIDEGHSELYRSVSVYGNLCSELDRPAAILLTDTVEEVKKNLPEKTYDSWRALAVALTEAGLVASDNQIKINGRGQRPFLNFKCVDELKKVPEAEKNKRLRELIVSPHTLLPV